VPRVASKDQQAMGKIPSFKKWAFAQFFVLSCAFPFRHGARPVSTFLESTFIQKYIFGLSGRKTFLGNVETRRAACRRQRSTGNGENTSFLEMLLQTFCSFLCLSLPTRGTPRLYKIHFLRADTLQSLCKKGRDAACRVSPAKINRQWGKYKLSGNAFGQFAFLLVPFPSDTRHAASLQKYKRGRTAFVQKCNFWRARLYRNTFFGTPARHKPL
jgi:hypothetical protein